MFIPGISKRSSKKRLEPRKGGGGGGRGGGGGGRGGKGGGRGGGSKGGSKGGGKGSGGRPSRPISSSSGGFNFGGRTRPASAYGGGGGAPFTIGAGLPFAGRLVGGGTRAQIFGTRTYGSGYSGYATRGVAGRPFPFYFWPIVWGGGALLVTDTYLDARHEYGDVSNSTRPGGPLSTATFQYLSVNTTFRLVADNDTVTSLLSDLSQNCSSRYSTNPAPTSTPLLVNASAPRPEQVVQYYRASSVALILDGYNNTATYAPEGTPDTPLPSNIDTTLLTCLNETIGLAAPLIDGGMVVWAPSYINLIGVVWALWALLRIS